MTTVEAVEAQAPVAGPAGQRALVRELADRLGETAAAPRHQLARVVDVLGEDRARALLAETLAVEGRGGCCSPTAAGAAPPAASSSTWCGPRPARKR